MVCELCRSDRADHSTRRHRALGLPNVVGDGERAHYRPTPGSRLPAAAGYDAQVWAWLDGRAPAPELWGVPRAGP